MRFQFEVGQRERHRIACSYLPHGDALTVTIDRVPVGQDLRFSRDAFVFSVGVAEQHEIMLERHPQVCRVYVDGELVVEAAAP